MGALEPVIHLVPQAVEMKTTVAKVSLVVEEGAAALTRPEGVRAVLRFMAVGVGLEAKPLAGLQVEPLFLEERAVMVPSATALTGRMEVLPVGVGVGLQMLPLEPVHEAKSV